MAPTPKGSSRHTAVRPAVAGRQIFEQEGPEIPAEQRIPLDERLHRPPSPSARTQGICSLPSANQAVPREPVSGTGSLSFLRVRGCRRWQVGD